MTNRKTVCACDDSACDTCGERMREEARAIKYGPKAPQSITAERFNDALNCLPPCRWSGVGQPWESFYVSERLSGNVVSWFVRFRDRYFQVDQDANTGRDEIYSMVRAAMRQLDHPATH